jgi:hypothetical protein
MLIVLNFTGSGPFLLILALEQQGAFENEGNLGSLANNRQWNCQKDYLICSESVTDLGE